MSRLIILPCHSIWKPGPSIGDSRSEWSLASFQVEGKDHLAFKEQIVTCLNILKNDSDSYLIISGGQTKKDSGPVSESLSYYLLALELLGDDIDLRTRITTEEFARDSFENVIFSICRYYEVFEKYPQEITIVGFEFKRSRFLDHHIPALKWPSSRVQYIGNSPSPALEGDERKKYFDDLDQSEHKHAVAHFEKDFFGIRAPLSDKKVARNPFSRYHGYEKSNPKLSKFLRFISDGSKEDNSTVQSALEDLPWFP